MKEKTIKMQVTAEEEELIMAIRNYREAYPNGHPRLLYYAEQLFNKMTDLYA